MPSFADAKGIPLKRGAAQGHGNIRSLQGKDLEGVLHGLQASGRILELTGGDGSRGDLIIAALPL